MKRIVFSRHARRQMRERGASDEEVVATIKTGEEVPAKHGRVAHRRNFQYNRTWGGRPYRIKQVMSITKEEQSVRVVITVYTFYF